MSDANNDRPCADCGLEWVSAGEWYMVVDQVWEQAWAGRLTPPSGRQILCIGCLEERIRRTLMADDFTDAPLNNPRNDLLSDRLRDRLTATHFRTIPGTRMDNSLAADFERFKFLAEDAKRYFGQWDMCDPVCWAIVRVVQAQNDLADAINQDAEIGNKRVVEAAITEAATPSLPCRRRSNASRAGSNDRQTKEAPAMKDMIDQLYPGVDPEFFSDDDISSEQWERMTLQQRTCVFCGRDDNHRGDDRGHEARAAAARAPRLRKSRSDGIFLAASSNREEATHER